MATTAAEMAQLAAQAREIYETRLRHELEPQNTGRYLVLDVDTGEYEIDDDGEAASQRAFQKNPSGRRYGMRIGHRAWGRIGSAARSRQ